MTSRIPLRSLYVSAKSPVLRRPLQLCQAILVSRQPDYLDAFQKRCRQYSTPTLGTSEASRPSDLRSQFQPISQPPPPPKPKRSLRRYIYATLFFMVGVTAGQYVSVIVAPPPLPLSGSKEDVLMVEYLSKKAEKLPIVQSLSSDPNWESYDPYQYFALKDRPHRFSTGPLGGARAVGGFQRIFSNKESGEIVKVVFLGGAISGWPGVVHGGISATLMDETLGWCALLRFPSRTGVTANLNINYLKPVVTNSFYVIRAIPEIDGATEQKQWVYGRLETMDGKVCVEGRGLFVVPKKYVTKRLLST